ncbi:MAG: ketoacyl-ACP synthase III [Clostridiales bacterium]|nr:ketoacyl-ACP synthase III [Clostridiales bacterium]
MGRGGVGILGTGSCLPEKVLTNADLEKLVDTSDEWIRQRTGMSERRIAAGAETATSLAIRAAQAALADAGVDGSRIGLVIVTTCTADYYSPSISCQVQHAIGAPPCAAFDMNAACTGSVYGLVVAKHHIDAGMCDYALVVSAELLSRLVDWTDRATCVLFGDGAGAFVLGRTPGGYGLLSSTLMSDGAGANMITIPGIHISDLDIERRGGQKKQTIWMDGGKVMKFASRAMVSSIEAVLEKAGLSLGDLSLVIPHQANKRIIDNAAKKLQLGPDRLFVNVQKYSNTSSASVPIALDEARREGRIRRGDHVALVAFGAGLTYGAALMRWA